MINLKSKPKCWLMLKKRLKIFTSTGYEEHESDPAINADPNGTGSPTLH